MVWPIARRALPPDGRLADGYALRTFGPQDAAAYLELMASAGFDAFDEAALAHWLGKVLPDGLFLAVHEATGRLAATAMASHNPAERHPFGGEVGWVAAAPGHRGRSLGAAVCAAAVARFLRAGYRRIYLKTDDWRLPALKTYLRLGFFPLLFSPDMAERWQRVCEQLDWPFCLELWSTARRQAPPGAKETPE